MPHVQADMTKDEFLGKLSNELWKFAGRCRSKADKLVYKVLQQQVCLSVKTQFGCHEIFIGKKYVKFISGRTRVFADRRLIYYRWNAVDDHEDVIQHFVSDLKTYYKIMFSDKTHTELQSYEMQRYLEQLMAE